MAKKDTENFDFETESEGKGKFDIVGFFKNLTKQQKGIILVAAVAIVLVVAIVITVVIIGTTGGNNNDVNNNGTTNNGGGNDDNIISNISIAAAPGKRAYYVGELPNYQGLVLEVNSGVDSSVLIYYDETPDDFIFTGFDSSVPVEEQVITVEYQGKTDTFTVEIKEIPENPILVSIHFSTYPQQIFNVDDSFSFRDGVLTCTYSDGSTVDIPLKSSYMYGLSEIFDPSDDHILLPGEHTIRIEYGEDGVFVQTEYVITVN